MRIRYDRQARFLEHVTAKSPAHSRHYALFVVPGHGLFVIRLTGYLTLKLEGYESNEWHWRREPDHDGRSPEPWTLFAAMTHE